LFCPSLRPVATPVDIIAFTYAAYLPLHAICFSQECSLKQRAQLKQVCDAKQASSSPHNDDRIDRAEVRKVFWNRSRAAVTMLKIQTVLR
jgi:hypothetical protein